MFPRLVWALVTLTLPWLLLAAKVDDSQASIPPRQISVFTAVPLADALTQINREARLTLTADPELLEKTVTITENDTAMWLALEKIAAQTASRIQLEQRGQVIRLKPQHALAIPSTVSGPFRVVVPQIDSRRLFESGVAVTDLALIIHWEPWLPVIRLDAQPRDLIVTDDQNNPVMARISPGKVAPLGAMHRTTVRLLGIPRAATRLTRFEGAFTITAAPAWLPFEFSRIPPGDNRGEPGKLPQGVEAAGVSARLLRFEQFDDLWEAEVRLEYPPGHPEFESFESWTAGNRVRLFRADQGINVTAVDPEVSEHGRTATGIYRFPVAKAPQGLRSAKLIVETPAALREFAVPFRLENIPLP